jgi:hypothetical protein
MFKRFALLVFGVGLLLILAPLVRADFNGYSKNLSNSPGSDSVFPKAVHVPGTTNVYVLWVEMVGTEDFLYFSKSTDEGATWTTPVMLNDSGQILERVSDLTDYYAFSMAICEGYIHVVTQWRQDETDDFEIWYFRSPDFGNTWEAAVPLTVNSTDSRYPDVSQAAQRVHITFSDSWPGNDEIMYKRMPQCGGGTVDLTRRLSFSSTASLYPRLALSKSGQTVNIVYQDDWPGVWNIFHKRVSNYGEGDYLTRQLTFGTEANVLPDVATSLGDDDQYVYFVYQGFWPGNRDIMYKRLDSYGNSGANTYTARLTYSETESRSNSISFDGLNNIVQISYHDNWPGNYDIMHRALPDYGGAGFTGQRVSWGTGDSSHASIVANTTGAYIVWSDNTGGDYEIYFKKGS